MKRIKLFEDFDDVANRLDDNIITIMIELVDAGFKYKSEIYGDDVLMLKIWREDKTKFVYSDVKDYILTIIDLYKELVSDDLNISYEYEVLAKMYGQEHFLSSKSEPKDDKMISSVDCDICNMKKS
jgi:hypothetical protein